MSEKQINDGGAAFPVLGERYGQLQCAEGGMSLRDYFAAKAMPQAMALCAHDGAVRKGGGQFTAPDFAAMAYEVADAMLAERATEAK